MPQTARRPVVGVGRGGVKVPQTGLGVGVGGLRQGVTGDEGASERGRGGLGELGDRKGGRWGGG